MPPLATEILTEALGDDGRGAVRRTLRLRTEAHFSTGADEALVLNISETGLLIESGAKLAVGETIFIDLPDASSTAARVMWKEHLLIGCEFMEAIPTGVVSGALLKAPFEVCNQHPVEPWEAEDRSLQTAALIIIMMVAGAAVIIFLAAVLAA